MCRLRGKGVQIHHLDANPGNNEIQNLAVLCFDCHRDTQIAGGFDRKLSAGQVRLYRDNWKKLVSIRHEAGYKDQISQSAKPVRGALDRPSGDFSREPDPARDIRLLSLIESLPSRRLTVYRIAQPLWDSGVTVQMVDANNQVIEALKEILIELALFYPEASFGQSNARDYFESTIEDLRRWHRDLVEPEGPGTGGTIVFIMTGGEVISSLEKMIAEMVQGLTSGRDDFNFHAWRSQWSDDFEIERIDGKYGREP